MNSPKNNAPAAGAAEAEHKPSNFLRQVIERDLAQGTYAGRKWSGAPGDAAQQEQGAPDPAKIRTRFPPEPNGYLHIGHAKSIWLNFGLAQEYGGVGHLRFDDTNPEKEEQEYVDGIIDVVKWLGYDWNANGTSHLYYASNYFDFMYRAAEALISAGLAYVDEQTPDEMRHNRGDFNTPGTNSPFRDRSPQANLDRFREMRDGKHADGAMVLRAKIDMASPNINLRDPAIYRIKHAEHHNTSNKWCIYPMYTYAHPIEDALENITHSICTLEFEDQRPFYDWLLIQLSPFFAPKQFDDWFDAVRTHFISAPGEVAKLATASWMSYRHVEPSPNFIELAEAAEEARLQAATDASARAADKFIDLLKADRYFAVTHFGPALFYSMQGEPELDPKRATGGLPHQYEFARLNLTYIVTSKRKLKQLVDEGHVSGWDDPRMPTLVGLRRRGYTPESLKLMAERSGVSKAGGWIDYSSLDIALRDDLEGKAPRAMAVLDPVKLKLTNWAEVFGNEGHREACSAPAHPHLPELGVRQFSLGPEVWIERDDFAEVPPKGFFRLFPGNKVRLKYGYVVECTGAEKDGAGAVTAVLAKLVPDTKSGTPGADAVKVKGTITWLGVHDAIAAEIRLYDRLFTEGQPDAGGRDFLTVLNPQSKKVAQGFVEPSLLSAEKDAKFQFERHGYFVADRVDHVKGKPVLNRVTGLKDSWGK